MAQPPYVYWQKAYLSFWANIFFLCTTIPSFANALIDQHNNQANQPTTISISAPAVLNFQTKIQILNQRKKYVLLHKELLADDYQPSPTVFRYIEDKKPWWGMHGAFIFGPGMHSIDGPAEESRFLFNPFLLVGANPGTALIWDTKKINNNDLKDPLFPFCWLPSSLTWYPSESFAHALYNVSAFNQQIQIRQNKLRFNPATLKLNQFGIIAYNARDFGFNYLYVDIAKSINIINTNGTATPVLIKQLIHCGNTAQYPGGCNNMSPAMPEIDRLAITALPARACIYLWHNQPLSSTPKADFTFYLDFQ